MLFSSHIDTSTTIEQVSGRILATMTPVNLIAAPNNPLAVQLYLTLTKEFATHSWCPLGTHVLTTQGWTWDGVTSCVYVPSLADRHGSVPDIEEADSVLEKIRLGGFNKVVLISSALIYGASWGRQALALEDYVAPRTSARRISDEWCCLEALAARHLKGTKQLTVIRPVTVHPSPAFLSRALCRKLVLTLPGYDPTIQLLGLVDLAAAVKCAVASHRSGTFNVAPDDAVSLHTAVRHAAKLRIALPRWLQRLGRPAELLEYLRYPWTVSNTKIKAELGFVPRKSPGPAMLVKSPCETGLTVASADHFGMDHKYIHFYSKTLFRFLSDWYWRVESNGLNHIPREGRGVLAGMHRGFMPFDGVMILNLLVRRLGRYPRFLTHPSLFKFPFLANFMTKLGGVIATQQSTEHLLNNDQLVAIFPEGIQGAFTPYREAYRIKEFGRHTFVKVALRHRAPIVPFVVIGSAEIFPIFGKLNITAWTRYSEWPYLPITPTFPLLPIPLPSKWHIKFLPAIHVEKDYPPEAASDLKTVKAISHEVRRQMQAAVDDLLQRRKSIFWGSILEPDCDC